MAEIGAMVEGIGTTAMPDDLIIEILLRLPALSILRFKSVCRVWLALFNLPNFIKNHARMALSSTKKNQQPSSLIVLSKFDDLYFVRFPFLGEPVNLQLPFEANQMSIEVVGSKNGLLCLNLDREDKTIVLWNPATREYNFIPDPELWVSYQECVSFGFAYDENTDCYKVIRMLYFANIKWMPRAFKAEVYSMKTNAWTQVEIGDFPVLMDHKPCCNVVSGCPYWSAYEPDERCMFIGGQVLMWFDATNDSFGFRRIPQDGDGHGGWRVNAGLGVEGDCPVAFGYSRKFGTKYSTALTHKITKLRRCDSDEDNDQMMLDSSKMNGVVGFWRSDKIIAFDMEFKISVYDSRSAKLKSFPVRAVMLRVTFAFLTILRALFHLLYSASLSVYFFYSCSLIYVFVDVGLEVFAGSGLS